MANRSESDVRQHETLPGPGPGAKPLPPGVRPVEQMVDAAIERIAREHGLSPIDSFDSSLATPMNENPRSRQTRLRWKGLDVSDEFRAYAERVARGEDLPPFEGSVLAEPNAAFPWGPAASEEASLAPAGRLGRVALWTSAVAVLGLLGWSVALKLDAATDADDAFDSANVQAVTSLQAAAAEDPATIAPEAQVELARGATDGVELAAPLSANGVSANGVSASETPASEVPVVGVLANAAPEVVAALPAPELVPSAVAPNAVVESVAAPAAPAASIAAPALPVAAVAPPAAPAAATSSTPAGAATAAPPLAERAAPVAPSKPLVDEFGLLLDAPGAIASQASAKTAGSTPSSVGDLARAGQASGANVRKEPGGESSAKGSLLVETPSF